MVDRNDAVDRIEAAVDLVGEPGERMSMVAEVMEADMARLNVTYNGANGDLPDPVTRDASDADIKRWATEAVRAGSVPGIPADPNADFTDFVVDRFPANEAVPVARCMLRPKTPFGRRRRLRG